MIGNLAVTLAAILFCAPAPAIGDASVGAAPAVSANPAVKVSTTSVAIRRAAGLYHRGAFDSTLAILHELEGTGPWKKRDSLAWLQYSGMASARLGRDSAATVYFTGLLSKDSQFQFPRNEDSLVMAAFLSAVTGDSGNAEDSIAVSRSSLPSGSDAGTTARPTNPVSVVFQTQGKADRPIETASSSRDTQASKPVAAGATNRFDGSGHRVGFAYGALPLGAGWVARGKVKSGIAFGILEVGGLAFSIFASEMQTRINRQEFGVRDSRDLSGQNGWQWAQRATLSTALGAYLFSIIAASGD